MKKKIPLKQKIYLPEYFKGNVAESFKKESDQRILYWNFDNAFDEKVKAQTEILKISFDGYFLKFGNYSNPSYLY